MTRPYAHSRLLPEARLRRMRVRRARTRSLDDTDLAVYAHAECGRSWSTLGLPDLVLLVGKLREIAACRAELLRARGARPMEDLGA